MPHHRSFFCGFFAGNFFIVLWWLIGSYQESGGRGDTSPSGRYELSIYSPSRPTAGGMYELTLTDMGTGEELRTVTVNLGSNEQTKSVRGATPITMTWGPAEAYVDVAIDGADLVRVQVP